MMPLSMPLTFSISKIPTLNMLDNGITSTDTEKENSTMLLELNSLGIFLVI